MVCVITRLLFQTFHRIRIPNTQKNSTGFSGATLSMTPPPRYSRRPSITLSYEYPMSTGFNSSNAYPWHGGCMWVVWGLHDVFGTTTPNSLRMFQSRDQIASYERPSTRLNADCSSLPDGQRLGVRQKSERAWSVESQFRVIGERPGALTRIYKVLRGRYNETRTRATGPTLDLREARKTQIRAMQVGVSRTFQCYNHERHLTKLMY